MTKQARWIVRQEREDDMSDVQIAKSTGVSARWVRKMLSRYGSVPVPEISYPPRTGRPAKGLPGRREHSAVISCCRQDMRMAVRQKVVIWQEIVIHILHHVIHEILRDEELAENQPKKAR